MADRWAEVREIEGRLAAKIVEHDQLRPWRLRDKKQLRSDIRYLSVLLRAAIDDVPVRSPGYVPPPIHAGLQGTTHIGGIAQ